MNQRKTVITSSSSGAALDAGHATRFSQGYKIELLVELETVLCKAIASRCSKREHRALNEKRTQR